MLLCCLLIMLEGSGCELEGGVPRIGPGGPPSPPPRLPSPKSLSKSFASSLMSSGLKSVSGKFREASPKSTSSFTPSLVSKESRNESVSDLTTPAQSLGVMGGFLSSLASPSPPAGGGEALSQPVALSPLTAGTEGGPPSGSDLMVGGGEDSAPSLARAVTASARELTDLIGWSGGAVDTGFFSFFILIVEIQHLVR